MATSMQKRGRRIYVSVRLNGHSVSATLDTKQQTKTWAMTVRKAIMDAHALGLPFNAAAHKVKRPRKLKVGLSMMENLCPTEPPPPTQEEIDADPKPRADWTVRRALRHWDRTETHKLAGWVQVANRIKMWMETELAKKRMTDLTAEDIVKWIAARRKTKKIQLADGSVRADMLPVSPSTIRNDVFRISVLFECARNPLTKGGWGLTELKNPVSDVTLPPPPIGRQRRLDHGDDQQAGEEDRILAALAQGLDGQEMISFVAIAIETGMRRSEVLGLPAREIRTTPLGRVVERDTSKNGHRRRVVLSPRATKAIDAQRAGKSGDDKLFRLDADNVAYRWDQARAIAGCPDLRMHDIRHEAISRMADAGLSVGALAAQSGDRTMQTLLSYVNASERDIREKLERRHE